MSGLNYFLLLLLLHLHHVQAYTYDFVIVGGGTSGCVLAARLCTSLPSARIVLLERGLPRNSTSEFLVRAPRLVSKTWSNPVLSEFFPSKPNPGLFERTSTIVTGNTLGGSSSLNGMQWTIPLGDTIDRWGVRGLSTTVAERYYRRAYQRVRFAQQPNATRQIYTDDYIEAAGKAGFPQEFAPFDQTPRKKIWNMAVATENGRRTDSCTAYLKPVLHGACSANLDLLQAATVTKVLLSRGTEPRATGVEYVHSLDTGQKYKSALHATKEVLLAAGPFGSPKLLQLSGIGPDEVLREAGVETRVHLGVGERTQARPFTNFVSLYTGVPLEPSNNSTLLESEETLRRWKAGESSVLDTPGLATIAVLKNIGYANFGTGVDPVDTKVLLSVCLSNPTTFGYLKIKDSNPFTSPEVQTNVLGSKKELARMKECLEQMSEIHDNMPGRFGLVPALPMDGVVTEEFIRNTSEFTYHFVGGSRVGGVVQSNLMVRGVSGLRVIDASVFKVLPRSAGPMASTYMLAEYASEKLAEVYRCVFERACSTEDIYRSRNGW